MYLGSYGVSFMEKAYRFYASVHDTRFALEKKELMPIQMTYLEFLPWVVYQGAIDPSQLGRYNVRDFFGQPDAAGARQAVSRLVATGAFYTLRNGPE